jgi:hypothetical protein
MSKRSRCFGLLVCLGLGAVRVAAAPADIEDLKNYYETTRPPQVQLLVEQSRDASVFTTLQVPAILAALKHQLERGAWANLSAADRGRLVDILNDPNMRFIYTGLQSSMTITAGGQTIDANTVKFHQDGWYSSGFGAEARSPHVIARIILHELGHVYHERYNYLPRPGPTKEWFPNALENQLPAEPFTPEAIQALTQLLNGKSNDAGSEISGHWRRDDSHVVFFAGSGGSVTGTIVTLTPHLANCGFSVGEQTFVLSQTGPGSYTGKIKWRSSDGRFWWQDVIMIVRGDEMTGGGHWVRE